MIKQISRIIFKNSVLICCLLLLFSFATGCSKDKGDISLPIDHLMLLADQEPDITKISHKKGWKKIDNHTLFSLPYPPINDFQYVWYKADFQVDNPEELFGLKLGRVYFTDITYLNGEMIGKRETSDSADVHFPRYYEIPKGLLKKGKNSLYVYVGIYGKEFGGIWGDIEILSSHYFNKSRLLNIFIFRQLPLGIFIFFGCQIISGIIFYFSRRKEFINLVALGIFFVWTSYLLALYSPYYPYTIDYRITYLWANVHIAPVFFFSYIQAHYKIYAQKMNAFLIPLLLVFALITVLNPDSVARFCPARMLAIISVILSVICGCYLFVLIGMNKPSKTIIVFLLFGAIPVSTVVWDIVNYLFITHQLPIVQIYALPFMFILFMVLQIADTLKQELKLSELKKELSKRDVQDTKTEKKFSLTSSMEEKLLKLKEFINDNYDSPISREGIAEALDLSPDYMSRMFKAHTGQKINDYINELRIESAGRQLLESNKKIIDIAFSVGFESLVTFNRAFSKIKKTSPSKYRQTGGKPE